jgi:hypothetical protein
LPEKNNYEIKRRFGVWGEEGISKLTLAFEIPGDYVSFM